MSVILDKVSYSYDRGTSFESKALDCISLTIKDGSFVGITGPTGSGKSTLATVIAGLVSPDCGSVNTSSKDVGLVFQYPEYQLFEETVLEDVMFGPLNQGLSPQEARENARKALSLVGLDESFDKRNPLLLSGGEKRRVAIAGVLALNRNILILDEPAAGLDPESHDRLFDFLSSLNKDGKTIIVVSHNMDDISIFCNYAVFLSEGKVIAEGKPSELPMCKSKLEKLKEELNI